MWKSGWKIEKTWIQGKERWLILLICGLILLILAVPTGWSGYEKKEQEVWAQQMDNTEKRIGAEKGNSMKTDSGRGQNSAKVESRDFVPTAYSVSGDAGSYEKELEQRVKEILKHVEGVGTVDVMITLQSSGEKIFHVDYDKNRSSSEEKDSSGGARKVMTEEITETSLMSGGAGTQEPVVEKELQPEIAGIVISAQGGGSASVKAEISEAMEALFGLPAHKIKVLKRAE